MAGLGWNYETQQAPSVAFAMSKALRKIYPNDEDYIEAMDNHFKYFNITPQMGNLVLGATLAMEEQDGLKAKDAVQNLKISLMGPLSGVGDSIILGIMANDYWWYFRIYGFTRQSNWSHYMDHSFNSFVFC